MFRVSSHFVWRFKTGDNINLNLSTLTYLYECYAQGDAAARASLRKPITIIIASIAEALLYDFHQRIKGATREGVPTLSHKLLAYVRGKVIDQFENCIASARKHKLFAAPHDVYNRLDQLRRLRNRIHIQNAKNDFEPDEDVAFSEARMVMAEQALEAVCKCLAQRYPRPAHAQAVDEFEFPWTAHFPDPA